MSLEDQIKDELVTDTATVLDSHIGEIKEFLELHQDGTIMIKGEYREVSPKNQALICLIGQRYAHEAKIVVENLLDIIERIRTDTDTE